jgi:hypothetical protein
MKKQVVWVMGPSAAGKETFTKTATQDTGLSSRLGWNGAVVVACPASIDYIKQSPDDPIALKREAILSQVPDLLENAGVVLIKWQFVDTDTERPQRLQAILPEVTHRAIVLHPPQDELTERLHNKPWWDQYGYESWIDEEVVMVADAIAQLPKTFDVTHLQSGSLSNYSEIAPATIKI